MMRLRFMLSTYWPPGEPRITVMATGAPTEPRSLATTSLSGRSIIDSPSIDRIWSPTWTPALAAGEPSCPARGQDGAVGGRRRGGGCGPPPGGGPRRGGRPPAGGYYGWVGRGSARGGARQHPHLAPRRAG